MINGVHITDYLFGRQASGNLRGLANLGLPVLVIVPMLWFMAYATGLFPWLGNSHRTESFHSVGSTKIGYSLGLKKFYFLEGQTVFVQYDVSRIDAGKLHIYVSKRWDFSGDNGQSLFVDEVSAGTLTFVVPESGFYFIKIGGSSGRGGYDLTYSASWGAYFAGFEPAEY